MSTETIRLIRDGKKAGRGYGGGGGGEGDYIYTYRYTVTTRMTSALRWEAMRVILMFHICEGQDSVHRPQLAKRKVCVCVCVCVLYYFHCFECKCMYIY